MTKRTLVVVVLFLATASFAWTYDVVLKNGKIVNGTFISEDEQKITIRDHSGIVMNFKKTSQVNAWLVWCITDGKQYVSNKWNRSSNHSLLNTRSPY